MKKPRSCLPLLTTVLFVAACSGDGDGGGPGDDGACREGGSASIVLSVAGLRADLEAAIVVSGPDGETPVGAATTLEDTPSGDYVITAEPVTDDDPIVRSLYTPEIDVETFCVGDGKTQAVTVSYTAVATSNRLWILNDGADAAVLGYWSADLGESGSPEAAAVIDAPAGNDLAFDREGNAWTLGPTTVDPTLVRYAAGDFESSGEKEPDRSIDVEGIACIPGVRAMAFDPDGNLWVSACGGEILRLPREALDDAATERTTLEADVVISGLTEENQDIAFDGDGNLWVADDGRAVRFDASRLDDSDGDDPDRAIAIRTSEDTQDIGADYLTFDAGGNLWVTDFGGNFVAKIPAADLDGSGEATVVSEASLVLAVSALLNRPAFDESGGLWISYSAGRVARIAPADLEISTGAGDPTVPEVILEGGEIANTENVAFFPAPADLPLYHALPR